MGVIAKQSIHGTIVTYLGVAVGFITTFFVLTRFLTTEEIGLARVLIDAATLFIGLAQLGTGSSVIRFFPYFKGRESFFFRLAMLIPLIGFGIVTLIYLMCYTPISHWFGEKSQLFVDYYYAVVPLAFFMLYQAVFEVCCNVRMKIVVPRAVKELITRVLLLAVYLMYAFRWISMDGFVLAICLVYGICALIDGVYFLWLENKKKSAVAPECANAERLPWVEMIRYTIFLVITSLASVFAPLISSFFISAEMGLNYTGIYAIATYMAVMVSIPYRSLTSIASPQLAAAIKEQDKQQTTYLMQQAANNLLLIGGLILAAIWVNIDLIFHLLPNGDTFATAKYVVLILGVSQLILSTFQICLNGLNFSGLYAYSLLWSVILTASTIIVNNWLIPIWGINGAAISNLICYGIYFMLVVGTMLIGTHTHPFSGKLLKTTILILLIFIINYLLQTYLPMGLWLGSIVRTAILLGGGLYISYAAELSPELNALLHKVFVSRH